MIEYVYSYEPIVEIFNHDIEIRYRISIYDVFQVVKSHKEVIIGNLHLKVHTIDVNLFVVKQATQYHFRF